MLSQLTYLQFLAVFVGLPLSVLVVGSVVSWRPTRAPFGLQTGALALMVALALVYTTPWDNYLIARGVWWYGDGVVATRIWQMPLGEYLFVIIQSVLVGVWTFSHDGAVDPTVGHSWRDRLVGVLAGVAVTLVGVAFLLGPASMFYMGAIFAWSGPVFALQWGVGWRYLRTIWRRLVVMVAVPVLYLSSIDRLAIEWGLWTISSTYSTGLTVGGLPLEEGVFFLVTSLFVAQALVLLRWVIARWG
ncbi:lycopene cyclase domain-containing protein [Salinibaculum rarum]|uniref:lycopene cyclase domain-containing protein n=1 Tax=Salinibaculum rarum TaxID=3058903 RepID=UPI00265F9294|nr:lycopene cyclase domain-containing protein [Salinibaculum sp. KK48]